MRRTATRDTEIGGQKIREGDAVVCWQAAANRDPELFEDPIALTWAGRRIGIWRLGVGAGTCALALRWHAWSCESPSRSCGGDALTLNSTANCSEFRATGYRT